VIPDFVHLHQHSQFSKFDGFSTIEGIVSKAKRLGMRAVGLTDHGTVAGIITFLKECRKQNIRPVLGMESYLCRNHKCHSKDGQPDGRKGNRHINVIAKNLKGYQNLCALSQTACLEGYYYDPRIDWELLEKHKEGIITTSACLSNVINYNLSVDNYAGALKIVGGFQDLFGEDFYLEMMYHGIDREGKILPDIQKLSKQTGVKIIATNDAHYLEKEDAEFQKVLMWMSTGRSVRDPKKISFPYDEFYLKTAEEMYEIFRSVPEYMRNTLEVAEKCDYSDIVFVENGGEMRLPRFDLPPGEDPFSHLTKMAWDGLRKIGWGQSDRHIKRLERELADIKLIYDTKRYDFSTYFLIVEDIARWARSEGIDAGVRGSGYGSVLLHCLGVCEGVDPLDYDLLWERFLGFDEKMFISEDDFGIQSSYQIDEDLEDLFDDPSLSEQGSGAAG